MDTMTVDLKCGEITDQFEGVFDLVIHAAKPSKMEGSANTQVEFDDHPLQIDFVISKEVRA